MEFKYAEPIPKHIESITTDNMQVSYDIKYDYLNIQTRTYGTNRFSFRRKEELNELIDILIMYRDENKQL